MLDFRHETFLALSRIGSYTKTAQALNITQPAVSQHIRHLEEQYNGKLFCYTGKTLTLTERGRLLRDFAMTMSADSKKLQTILSASSTAPPPVIFGATLTIGEYTMPSVLAGLMTAHPNLHITMLVDNTSVLLGKLRDGTIDFALLEGFCDKTQYGGAVLAREPFIPVCSPQSPLAGRRVQLGELLPFRLILRENGSGTRDIFEQLLREHNLTTNSFAHLCEVGNMSAIKQLVSAGLGVTFLYRAAVARELAAGTLVEIDIDGFSAEREFNFVFLQNSLHEQQYMQWFTAFQGLLPHP
ncbi:MAG: LysR family transcriptional regulator [Angelakisella sp.]